MSLNSDQLRALGFASYGAKLRIDPAATFHGCEWIRMGNDVRIDCHVLITAGPDGGVTIGDHVHLAAGCYLFGAGAPVVLEDFSGLSSRVTIYTATDDYTDGFLTNPTVPYEYRKVTTGAVTLRRHAIVGSGSVIMPGVELGVGASVGALSFVTKSVPEFTVVFGSPARKVGDRGRRLLELEKHLRSAES